MKREIGMQGIWGIWTLVLSLAPSLLSCGGSTVAPTGENPSTLCQPIADKGCFLPFPSSFYEQTDAASETGFRVAIPLGVLPKNQVGRDYDVSRLNVLDGFSPASQIIAGFGPGVRVLSEQLPGYNGGYEQSTLPGSTVQLFEYDTGARVPVFAEVDANVTPSLPDALNQEQVVLIHPAARLKPKTRYVVALVSLLDERHAPIVVTPFRALASGSFDSGSRLTSLKTRYDGIFAMLEKQGVSRAALTLAWDFTTASDKQGYSHVLQMRDVAFARWEKEHLGWSVTHVDEPLNDVHLFRGITGTFQVPSFLTDNTTLYAGLKLDANFQPVDTQTNYDAKLIINVPNCAKTAKQPLPIIVFGHGLFGSATQILTDQQTWTADTLCMVEVATDWVGLSDYDMNGVVARVFSNFDDIYQPTDRLQQAQVNFLVLARLAARRLKEMPELQINGAPIVDGKEIYYFGISQGGIEGNTLLSLSPEINRGALNVGAGIYPLMLTRSGDFEAFKGIMNYTYPSQSDQELLLALSQSYFDFSDPITFVVHTLADPLPDENGHPMTGKHILQQEGRYDAEVPNVATRVLARTAKLPQLAPPVETVFGLTTATGPLDSAYTQWDIHATPQPPITNVPAKGNDAHNGTGKIPQLIEQLRQFFRPDGQIVQTCTGPCVFTP